MYNVYLGIIGDLPIQYTEGVTIPFPGRILQLGSEGEDVRVLQEYLRYISNTYMEIPAVTPDGVFGVQTQNAVTAFQDYFGIAGVRGVVANNLWNIIAEVYEDLYSGNLASEGQFPGYTVSE